MRPPGRARSRRVADHELRHADAVDGSLDHDADRVCGHGGADVIVTVGELPAAGREDVARAHPTRVVADRADDLVPLCSRHRRRSRELPAP